MITPLKTQAIQIALTGNWKAAIALNKEILKGNPDDIDTLNRLGFAYGALGSIKEAKSAYQKVLRLDKAHPIAQKQLKRLEEARSKTINASPLMSSMFLEESGKTKIVSLINTTQPKVLRGLHIGQKVLLCIKRSKIFVQDEQKQFLGMLPDDLGGRLIKFLNGGNTYDTYVKSVEDHTITIFIREVSRVTRFKNQPTFLFGDKTHLDVNKAKMMNHSGEDVSEEG